MLVEFGIHAVDAANALNEAGRIPRNVVVDDDVGAVEVHAFREHFRGNQNPVVVARVECVGIKVGDDSFMRRFVRLARIASTSDSTCLADLSGEVVCRFLRLREDD